MLIASGVMESAHSVGAMMSLPQFWDFAETALRERGLMATREQDPLRCPSCESQDIRRSKRQGILDGLSSILGFLPYRCEDCNHRFFKWSFLRRDERRSVD